MKLIILLCAFSFAIAHCSDDFSFDFILSDDSNNTESESCEIVMLPEPEEPNVNVRVESSLSNLPKSQSTLKPSLKRKANQNIGTKYEAIKKKQKVEIAVSKKPELELSRLIRSVVHEPSLKGVNGLRMMILLMNTRYGISFPKNHPEIKALYALYARLYVMVTEYRENYGLKPYYLNNHEFEQYVKSLVEENMEYMRQFHDRDLYTELATAISNQSSDLRGVNESIANLSELLISRGLTIENESQAIETAIKFMRQGILLQSTLSSRRVKNYRQSLLSIVLESDKAMNDSMTTKQAFEYVTKLICESGLTRHEATKI